MRSSPAGDFDYEATGHGYARRRRPDPRIASQILAALGDAATMLNVGAGAGSYEPADRPVLAVEPSQRMRAQRPASLSPAIDAVAEALPFDDGSFDAAMATITVHQWSDPEAGLAELRRVARERVVVMAFDPDAAERFWLAEYAPELIAAERLRDPGIERIRAGIGRGEVAVVPIPIDCVDGFTEAYYARPEAFLDDDVRAAQSAWGFTGDADQRRIVDCLRADLESGEWDRRFGEWRAREWFEGSLRLVVAEAADG